MDADPFIASITSLIEGQRQQQERRWAKLAAAEQNNEPTTALRAIIRENELYIEGLKDAMQEYRDLRIIGRI